MKALTIRQPRATLIALGVKTIETRSWRAPVSLIGQHFAIHAGAKRPTTYHHRNVNADVPPWIDLVAMSSCWDWREHPDDFQHGGAYVWRGPLGAIVATARLVDCVPMVDLDGSRDLLCDGLRPHVWVVDGKDPMLYHATDARPIWTPLHDQLPYGDFTAGRWAWLLDDVKPTTERCPACMGKVHPTGLLRPGEQAMGRTYGDLIPCPQFFRAGTCPPIPAKGRQGLWTWAP